MSLTQTEKLGFGRNLIGLVDEVAPELEGTALGPGKIKDDLLEKEKRAAQANARQEDAKRASMEATAEMDGATDAFYRAASGYLDAIIGVVGKGSPAARNMARLRSRIRAAGDQVTDATTPGGTPPTAQQ
ncbi:MAG TPA: hypothetical protein VGR51_02525 [Thermoplasmata archaeon]|nr:hypothetical protein [Thermoplasmata archaeon]